MADRVLREQCEHGRYDWHDIKPTWSHPHKPNPYENNRCPGGREVTIDYEAAAVYLSGLIFQSADDTSPGEFDDYADKEARRIVDAALGEV